MAEILYELGVEGGPETTSTFEDLRVKQLQASDATKRLQAELRKLERAGSGTASEIERLQRQVVRADMVTKQLASSAREAANAQNLQKVAMHAVRDRTAAMAQALGQLGTMVGQTDPRLESLSRGLSTVGQAASMGAAAFGPWGAALGAVGGAIHALNQDLREQEEAHLAAAAAARHHLTSIDELMGRIAADTQITRLQAGLGSVTEQTQALELAQARLNAEHRRVRETRERLAETTARYREIQEWVTESTGENGEATGAAAAQLKTYQDRIRSIQADLRAFNVSLETQQHNTIALAGALKDAQDRENEEGRERDRRARRERAAADARSAAQQEARELEALRRTTTAEEVRIFADGRAEMRRLGLDHYASEAEALRAHIDTRMQLQSAETAWYRQELQQRAAAEREVNQAIAEEMRVMDETDRQRVQIRQELWRLDQERRLEDFEREQGLAKQAKASVDAVLTDVGASVTSILGQAVTGIMGAIQEVAKGTMTAGEAFQGLLASFLEMLSQMAALEAIKHYAAAIGAFASQDYAGGAAHLAAGVAWTVVAVAAGGAAVAAAPAAQTAAPAAPEASNDNGQAGAGTTHVHFHSDVVTATTRAELGRDIAELVAEGGMLQGGRVA